MILVTILVVLPLTKIETKMGEDIILVAILVVILVALPLTKIETKIGTKMGESLSLS